MLLAEGGDKHDVAFSKIPRRMLCPQTTVGATPFEFMLLKQSWLWEAASFHSKQFLERAEGAEPARLLTIKAPTWAKGVMGARLL